MHYSTLWTIEMTDRLRQKVADNYSDRQIMLDINAEFGTCLTRNAIIGKRSRLGLLSSSGLGNQGRNKGLSFEGRHRPEPTANPRPRKPSRIMSGTSNRNTTYANMGQFGMILPDKKSGAPIDETPFQCDAPTVALLDLEKGQCRWPIGSQFCGQLMCGDSKSYCGHHYRASLRHR